MVSGVVLNQSKSFAPENENRAHASSLLLQKQGIVYTLGSGLYLGQIESMKLS